MNNADGGSGQPQPPLFAARIPNGRVFGKASIAVLTDDDQVLAEVSVAGFRGNIEEHRIFRQFRLPRARQLEPDAAVLAVPGGNTYYHWLFDLLPRLEIVRLAGWPVDTIGHFVVNGHERPFQRETLDRLGLSGKLVSLEKTPHVKASQLIVPSFTGLREKAPRWVCDFLRRLFLSANPPTRPFPRKIYISRAHAKSRPVANEPEVTKFLERSGFQAVRLEDLKVTDQALLFANAEWIIGAHGSGFANLVFCTPGAKVLEIFPPGLIKDMYEHLARQSALNYRGLVCESSSNKADRRTATVDLRLLEESITALS